MRRFLIPVALVMALCAVPMNLAAQANEGQQMKVLPQDELDVIKVLLAQERSWNLGDMESFIKGYKNDPDILFIGKNVSRGFEGMAESYKKNYPDKATMGRLTFSDLEPHLLDDQFAVVTGRFALERAKNKGGNASGIFSLVLEKTDEGWKIILDHTSS